MTRASADPSPDRVAEDRRDGDPPDHAGPPSDRKAGRINGNADAPALTSGKAAEAIERATAAVGSDEDEAP